MLDADIEMVTVGKDLKTQASEFCVAHGKGRPSRNGKEKLALASRFCVAYGGKLHGISGDFL